jgi:hypothetical protein
MRIPSLSLSCAFVTTACLLFSTCLPGQSRLPGLPVTAPPVDHPALQSQPGMQRPSQPAPALPSPGPQPEDAPPAPPPETQGEALRGKELKRAVASVVKLHWHDTLAEAKVQAGASGKPILLLQALGDLEGFA